MLSECGLWGPPTDANNKTRERLRYTLNSLGEFLDRLEAADLHPETQLEVRRTVRRYKLEIEEALRALAKADEHQTKLDYMAEWEEGEWHWEDEDGECYEDEEVE